MARTQTPDERQAEYNSWRGRIFGGKRYRRSDGTEHDLGNVGSVAYVGHVPASDHYRGQAQRAARRARLAQHNTWRLAGYSRMYPAARR